MPELQEKPEVVGDSGKLRVKVGDAEELMQGQICLLCTIPALTPSEMEGRHQVLSKARSLNFKGSVLV